MENEINPNKCMNCEREIKYPGRLISFFEKRNGEFELIIVCDWDCYNKFLDKNKERLCAYD